MNENWIPWQLAEKDHELKVNLVAFSMNGKVRAKNEDGFFISIGKNNLEFISSETYKEQIIYSSGLIEADWITSFIIDGMGGMGDGDVARDVLLQSFQTNLSSYPESDLIGHFNNLLEKANQFLLNVKGANHYKDMGAVTSSGLFYKSQLYISHLGDARIYLIREGAIQCLTTDHTYINQLLKNKKITHEDAKSHSLKNMVLKSLGFEKEVNPDKFSLTFLPGDLFLFFTDGIYGEVSDIQVESIFNQEISLDDRMQKLITSILQTSCNDNFTAISIQIL